MLGNLDSPERIGPAMSVALLTTLYGALMANVVSCRSPASWAQRDGRAVVSQIYTMGRLDGPAGESPPPRDAAQHRAARRAADPLLRLIL
jgi:chemotaxis protein MotA